MENQNEQKQQETSGEEANPVDVIVSARCPDCAAQPGMLHKLGCDVEKCPECGWQYISCDCPAEETTAPRLLWSGEWPGIRECREFGWYSKLVSGRGWVSCDKSEPGASESLNRLAVDATWDKEKGRYILES